MSALAAALTRTGRTLVGAPLALFGVSAVWFAAGAALLLSPWTQLPFLIFGLAPLLGGYVDFCAQIARGAPPRPSALLSGFAKIDRWTGVVVMTYLHLVVACLPLVFAIGIGNMGPPTHRWMWWVGGAVISTPLVLEAAARLMFVIVVANDAPRSISTAAIFELATARRRATPHATLAGLLIVAALAGAGAASTGWLLPLTTPFGALWLIHLYDATTDPSD